MRWEVGEGFDRLPEWWRTRREASLLEVVPLGEFLVDKERENHKALNTYPVSGGLNRLALADFESVPIRSPPSSRSRSG